MKLSFLSVIFFFSMSASAFNPGLIQCESTASTVAHSTVTIKEKANGNFETKAYKSAGGFTNSGPELIQNFGRTSIEINFETRIVRFASEEEKDRSEYSFSFSLLKLFSFINDDNITNQFDDTFYNIWNLDISNLSFVSENFMFSGDNSVKCSIIRSDFAQALKKYAISKLKERSKEIIIIDNISTLISDIE